ncbi:MAG: CinA family protein [Clostridia bacterium]|nr:CinA family protein [Clostridia bacterium]
MKDNIFKCFGISTNEVKTEMAPFLKDNQGVYISIEGEQLLVDIILQADDNNTFFYEVSRTVYEKFSKYIYAESNISLEQTAFELLKLSNLKLAIAESITGGEIVSSFIKDNIGASEVLIEGDVVYSNDAKIRRLGVSEKTLDTFTSVSLETAYDMAKGLLQTSPADVVVVTTGYASSTSPKEDGGLVFIGIGDKKRIEVFKNRFTGTRKEIIETTAKAALFYLVKKLRKNDFILNGNTI